MDNHNSRSGFQRSEISFTRTTVVLLLLGSFIVSALAGAGAAMLLGRSVPRPATRVASGGASSSPALAVQRADPVTVAITAVGTDAATAVTPGSSTRKVLGTGVVLDREGHILTTRSVVNTNQAQVVFSDGRNAIATVVGRPDSATGLVVLQVSATIPQQPMFARSARMRVGDYLVSIGTATRTLDRTVDVGIAAGLSHKATLGSRQEVDNLIRSDASAPEGAVGGPVVNLRGEVVGITVGEAAPRDGWALILPAETAQSIAKRILSGGTGPQASLRISTVTITPQLAKAQGLSQQSGALVNAILPGSPAAKVLRPRDIVYSIQGRAVDERHTLSSLLAAYRPGQRVNVQFFRNGLVNEGAVVLATEPTPAETPVVGEATP